VVTQIHGAILHCANGIYDVHAFKWMHASCSGDGGGGGGIAQPALLYTSGAEAVFLFFCMAPAVVRLTYISVWMALLLLLGRRARRRHMGSRWKMRLCRFSRVDVVVARSAALLWAYNAAFPRPQQRLLIALLPYKHRRGRGLLHL